MIISQSLPVTHMELDSHHQPARRKAWNKVAGSVSATDSSKLGICAARQLTCLRLREGRPPSTPPAAALVSSSEAPLSILRALTPSRTPLSMAPPTVSGCSCTPAVLFTKLAKKMDGGNRIHSQQKHVCLGYCTSVQPDKLLESHACSIPLMCPHNHSLPKTQQTKQLASQTSSQQAAGGTPAKDMCDDSEPPHTTQMHPRADL